MLPLTIRLFGAVAVGLVISPHWSVADEPISVQLVNDGRALMPIVVAEDASEQLHAADFKI
jgi:hypothetical protein